MSAGTIADVLHHERERHDPVPRQHGAGLKLFWATNVAEY
jgi:hypothetical protein